MERVAEKLTGAGQFLRCQCCAGALVTIDTPQPGQYHPGVNTKRDAEPDQPPADTRVDTRLPVVRRSARGQPDRGSRIAVEITIASQAGQAVG